jgi:hypothetical protein
VVETAPEAPVVTSSVDDTEGTPEAEATPAGATA